MTAFLALLPCAVAIFSVLTLRVSGLSAALLALLTALALWGSGVFSPIELSHLSHAITDALVLELLVGVVILSGLLFVEVSNNGGGLGAIGDLVRSFELPISRALLLITLGVGVTLESLTGFGVSMFLTIPLLLQVVSRRKAINLALIGMGLMTWGTLSIAILLGAQIGAVPLQDLAVAVMYTSAPIAIVLPIFCVLLADQAKLTDVTYVLIIGVALIAGIAITTHWIGVEVAGVGGGLAVIVVSLIGTSNRTNLSRVLTNPALLPYGLLIGAVSMQKIVVAFANSMGVAPKVDTSRVSFDVLGSPAIALGLVALICIALQIRARTAAPIESLIRRVLTRSWRALTSIFLFLLTARLLIEIGGDTSVAQLLSHLGVYAAAAAIAVLGGFGAYVTGSGVASNALFMPSAVATGQNFDASVVFAALQHCGASHVAMASLPIIVTLLAALPDRASTDEQIAMRTGLGLATIWMALLIASGWVQLALR